MPLLLGRVHNQWIASFLFTHCWTKVFLIFPQLNWLKFTWKSWYGCFLKWWYPQTPKMIIFRRKTYGCWVQAFQETPICFVATWFYAMLPCPPFPLISTHQPGKRWDHLPAQDPAQDYNLRHCQGFQGEEQEEQEEKEQQQQQTTTTTTTSFITKSKS